MEAVVARSADSAQSEADQVTRLRHVMLALQDSNAAGYG
jgi:hypothetical protein